MSHVQRCVGFGVVVGVEGHRWYMYSGVSVYLRPPEPATAARFAHPNRAKSALQHDEQQ